MPYELIYFSNDAELAKKITSDWFVELRRRTDLAKPYSVALSGGRIALTFFAEITRQSKETGELQFFENVHFFWADEHCVPPGDSESNYAIAQKLLFEPLKIPANQVHRLRGEGPEAAALQEAISAVKSVNQIINGQPAIDLIFLGTGEDGHTASLFPGESEAVIADPAIYRAVTAVKLPPRRITLGYPAIAAAKKVWVLVSGKGKEQSFAKTLSPNGKTPLGRVLRQRSETKIYSDVTPQK